MNFSTNRIICGGCQVMIVNVLECLRAVSFFANECWTKHESCVQPHNLWEHYSSQFHKICLHIQKRTFFVKALCRWSANQSLTWLNSSKKYLRKLVEQPILPLIGLTALWWVFIQFLLCPFFQWEPLATVIYTLIIYSTAFEDYPEIVVVSGICCFQQWNPYTAISNSEYCIDLWSLGLLWSKLPKWSSLPNRTVWLILEGVLWVFALWVIGKTGRTQGQVFSWFFGAFSPWDLCSVRLLNLLERNENVAVPPSCCLGEGQGDF